MFKAQAIESTLSQISKNFIFVSDFIQIFDPNSWNLKLATNIIDKFKFDRKRPKETIDIDFFFIKFHFED